MTGLAYLSFTAHRIILRFILLLLTGALLFGCSKQPADQAVQATIHITKIVDKATQQPITSNVVTLRWETPDGETIKTETYNNQSELKTTMPADGKTRLLVYVEAPGYVKWGQAIRMKLNEEKPVSFPVEMGRIKGRQGI